jgi:PilZ domain
LPSPPPTRKVRTVFRERRRWRRRRAGPGVACQLHHGGATLAAVLLNVAEGGACVELPLPLSAGDRLTLLLVNGACLAALAAATTVVWSVPSALGCRAGLCFDSPLSAADLLPFLS